MTLSAIRNIADKDGGPSERPWTAAKSALEQERIALARQPERRRRFTHRAIFRASRRCRRAGLPSCSVEAAKPAMKTNRISTETRSGREQ
ncbi:hypothetical protein CU276_15130 [Yersinia kristensenii]|nr:hypothetical protein CU276_15130 [Yersinia kristensenii]